VATLRYQRCCHRGGVEGTQKRAKHGGARASLLVGPLLVCVHEKGGSMAVSGLWKDFCSKEGERHWTTAGVVPRK
jgi:hypothetical protein